MDRDTLKDCVATVMETVAAKQLFKVFESSAYKTGNAQEEAFIDAWNKLYKGKYVAKTQKQVYGDEWDAVKDSYYGDIYIFDASDLEKPIYYPVYCIDLKVAKYNNKKPSDTIGTITVISLANFTSSDEDDNHYYLVSSFDGSTYRFFRAKRLLSLITHWYSNPNWKIKHNGECCQDYIQPTKLHRNDAPTYRYQEHWTSDKNESGKILVHPKMMQKVDEDYIPEYVIKHFNTLD